MWPYLEIKHIQKKFNVVFVIFNTKAGFSENFFGICVKRTVLLNGFKSFIICLNQRNNQHIDKFISNKY